MFLTKISKQERIEHSENEYLNALEFPAYVVCFSLMLEGAWNWDKR